MPSARVPSVERVLSSAPLQPLLADYGRTRVLNAVRAELERWRSDARTDPAAAEPLDEARIAAASRARSPRSASAVRPVFNLTGTVLHTNLGRAAAGRRGARGGRRAHAARQPRISRPAVAATATT
jgi:L-seryl-tRNA(Ser) seleniumtransferase